jgi:hypothetical protein
MTTRGRMQWKSYRIHANDEVRRIGSGRRTVLAMVGRKWVRIKSRVSDGWAQRVHINTWNKILIEETNDA